MVMSLRHRHNAIESVNDHYKINTFRDSHNVRINSRNYTGTTGDNTSKCTCLYTKR